MYSNFITVLYLRIDSADVTVPPTSLSDDGFENSDNNSGEDEGNETLQGNKESHEEGNEVCNKLRQSDFKESLYHYYCGELVGNGIFKWRTNTFYKKAAVMNDYNCDSGSFMVSIKVTCWVSIECRFF